MKISNCDVAIIGAGPYGLAATAHLRSAGLKTWTFGQCMEFWQNQMPAGMLLRSPWDASHIADAHGALTLDKYEKARGIRLSRPVPLNDFIEYGRWFQRQVVPDLDTRRVQQIQRTSSGFRLLITGGETFETQRVVIAAGIGPFARRPSLFSATPQSLASHSSDHRDLSCFVGRHVIVVGGGQSAIESAALLHETGADVELVVRRPKVRWLRRSALFHSAYNPLFRLLYHRTDVGPAVLSQLVSRPDLVRRLPLGVQRKVDKRSIQPAGAAWLIPRVKGVRITTGRDIVTARPQGSQISITLDDGSVRCVDHVLLGTGYRVNVSKYAFLSQEMAQSLSLVDGYPQLDHGFESSIPGLYFVGAPAAWSFGPLMRFVSGTEYASRRLAQAMTDESAARLSSEKIQWVRVVKSQSGW